MIDKRRDALPRFVYDSLNYAGWWVETICGTSRQFKGKGVLHV
jgi:hypothetical protein